MTRKWKGRVYLLSGVLVGLALLLLAACGQAKATPTPAAGAPAPAATPTPAPKVYKWVYQQSWAGPPFTTAGSYWAKKVMDLSGGRIQIDDRPGGAIVPAYTETKALLDGTIDATHTGTTIAVGQLGPWAELYSFHANQMLWLDYVVWYYQAGGRELFQEMLAPFNIGFAEPATILPPESMGWCNKKITKLEDFKGLKYRIFGYMQQVVNKMGGQGMAVAGAETYAALERGIVDCAEYSTPSIDEGLGFPDVAKYMLVPGIHQPSTLLVAMVRKDRWEELPPDLKLIVMEASKAATLESSAFIMKEDAAAVDRILKKGKVEIVKMSPELQRQIAVIHAGVMDEFAAKDEKFRRVLESQRSFLKTWNQYLGYSWSFAPRQ